MADNSTRLTKLEEAREGDHRSLREMAGQLNDLSYDTQVIKDKLNSLKDDVRDIPRKIEQSEKKLTASFVEAITQSEMAILDAIKELKNGR